MGLVYAGNNEIVTLYQAYGLTVNGIIHDYVWTIYENKREKCYTYIEFLDAEGNIFYSRQMGNNVILEGCFQKHIDNVLWYLSHDTDFDKSNSYDFDKLITDVLIKNSALFSYRIEQRKQNEKRKEEETQRIAERQAEEKKQIDSIKDYCSRKGLFFYQDYSECYLLKAHTETALNMITTADKKQMDYIIDFARKYPDNKDVQIVKHDTMENILKYIK